jgi:AcrR family transcriptional regulator
MAKPTHSRADYFARAMQVLEEDGFPALTAAGLCSSLGVTRGSFYHHFDSFDDFVDQFLAYWEETYSTDLIERSTSSDLAEQVRLQTGFAVGLRHEAEAALRAWASVNPRVAEAQQRVDSLRQNGLSASLQAHGVAPETADLYATIAIATLVGMQVTRRPFDPALLERMYAELTAALAASRGGPDQRRTTIDQ